MTIETHERRTAAGSPPATIAKPPFPRELLATPTTSALSTATRRTIAYAVSTRGRPWSEISLRATSDEAIDAAIADAEAALHDGDPATVLTALVAIANRRNMKLPGPPGLDMDVGVMASWPRDLFLKAFRSVWETFGWARFPEVADFHKRIEGDLEARRCDILALRLLKSRLGYARLAARRPATAEKNAQDAPRSGQTTLGQAAAQALHGIQSRSRTFG